jgi:hypothetical protein
MTELQTSIAHGFARIALDFLSMASVTCDRPYSDHTLLGRSCRVVTL